VAFARKDFIHKLTKRLVCDNQTNAIAIEDLNIKGMIKNRKLARSITDAGWGMFASILKQKAVKFGTEILTVDRFAPTSKLCTCGYKNMNLKLSQREWSCPSCGSLHDRDILAALNIKSFALKNRDGEARIQARGDFVNPSANLVGVSETRSTSTELTCR
jgi:putative transposase